MKKDSLVKGTVILAAAALIARGLGVVQRIPLVHLIQDTGMGLYSSAFNIYMILLTIATAGLPSAVSKLVSERMETGRYAEAEHIRRAAVRFSLAAGVAMTVLLLVLAPYYASWTGAPGATRAIQLLAPALLLFPLIAIMRGYFQGRQMMMPNGLSQIIEQIARVVSAVLLAYVILAVGWEREWAVGGASFGGVLGSIAATVVLLHYFDRLRRMDKRAGTVPGARSDRSSRTPMPRRDIYKLLFHTSIPIVLFSIAVPAIYFLDSSTVIPLLRGSIGQEEALRWLGILGGRAQSLAGIPIIFAIALSQSIVPIVSSAFAAGDRLRVSDQASRALRLSVVTGLPVALVLAIAARPVNALLFVGESGSALIALLTLTAVFQIVMQTSGAILMGLGQMRPLVRHVLWGLGVKLIASLMLSQLLGIYGIAIATALCFIVMMALNLRTLRQHTDYTILTRPALKGLAISVAATAAAGWGLERLMHASLPLNKLTYLIQSVVVGGFAAVVLLVLMYLTRVVTKEDVDRLPAPLRRLLARGGRMLGLVRGRAH